MDGINRALTQDRIVLIEKAIRVFSDIKTEHVPCIFICYQRKDEKYASEVAEYIMSKQLDVYFDLKDSDLKLHNQTSNPKGVTEAIKRGLNNADFMLVIVSPDTYLSPWVPFEVGYACDKKGDKMKLLRHKLINKNTMPAYLKVKEMLDGTASLDRFLVSIRRVFPVYENILQKGEKVKAFSTHQDNPLNKYLDNE